MDGNCFFTWEFCFWVSISVNLAWSSLWIVITCSECSLIWFVMGMVVRMTLRKGLCSISSWSCIKSSIFWWDPLLVMESWWHILNFIIKISCKNISALFGKSLLKKRICCNHWSITLILWNNIVFSSHRFESVRHIIRRSSIHMTSCPFLYTFCSNTRCSIMLGIVELVFCLTHIGVIKSWSI